MAGKIPGNNVRCSFCGKSQGQVRRLLAGPNGIFICDECIDLCADILDEELEEFEDDEAKKESIDNISATFCAREELQRKLMENYQRMYEQTLISERKQK